MVRIGRGVVGSEVAGLSAEQTLDALDVGGGHLGKAVQASGAGGRLVLELVSAVGPLVQDPAAAADPEPLGGSAVRLVLGHELSYFPCEDTGVCGTGHYRVIGQTRSGSRAGGLVRQAGVPCRTRVVLAFLCGAMTMIMFRPSCLGADSM